MLVIGIKFKRKGCSLHAQRKIMQNIFIETQKNSNHKEKGKDTPGPHEDRGRVSMSRYNVVHKPIFI